MVSNLASVAKTKTSGASFMTRCLPVEADNIFICPCWFGNCSREVPVIKDGQNIRFLFPPVNL